MKIEEHYPIKIEHWMHLPANKFIGQQFHSYNFIFGISPEDPMDEECCYFNIWNEKKIYNESTKTIVFYAKTYSAFKVRNKSNPPSPEFFFELVLKAGSDFAKLFYTRTKGTNLLHHKIRKPVYSELKQDIIKTIDHWNKKIKINSITKFPDWQSTFKNLPPIPEHKKWKGDSHTTLEQDISFSLLKNEPISKREENIFKELSSFYFELDNELKKLDYKAISKLDFENFKNYIFYAFNYLALISNELTVFTTYRLVVNESITGNNESITDIKYLKYPSLEIVKKINKYNRANTPETNVFYSSETIDTAIKEIRPPLNKKISVGIWKPIDNNKKLISFPIFHSEEALKKNKAANKAKKSFDDHFNFTSPLLMDYMGYYFKLLGREYTKRVYNHYEYLISGLFSERILSQKQQENLNFRYDCIVYPSVGNEFVTDNLAMTPETLDNDFWLSEVMEFEIIEQYYDSKNIAAHPEMITLAKINSLKRTSNISESGVIKW